MILATDFGMRVPGTRPRERAKKLLLFDEMRDCVRGRALDAIVTDVRFLLLTKFCEQTCHMTKTQVITHSKTKMDKKAPLGDCLPPLVPTPGRKRRRSQTKNLPATVPPCELLLDEHGTMAVAVGELAMPVAALGAEEWPLPNELLLLLEPGQQPEVLAEVGLDDQLREWLSSVDAAAIT